MGSLPDLLETSDNLCFFAAPELLHSCAQHANNPREPSCNVPTSLLMLSCTLPVALNF